MIPVTVLILKSRVFYKSDLLLIHGRLGKFTDKIDLSEAMAGWFSYTTNLFFGPYNNCWKKYKGW